MSQGLQFFIKNKWTGFLVCLLISLVMMTEGRAQDEKYDTRLDTNTYLDNRFGNEKNVHRLYGQELEDKMMDVVWELPEVKSRNAYLKSISKSKRHLGIVIYQRHIGEEDYYWIKVGEDFGGMIVSHFNFFVDPRTLGVKFYDAEKDMVLDLATWRRRQSK